MWETRQLLLDSQHKEPVMQSFEDLVAGQNKFLYEPTVHWQVDLKHHDAHVTLL